MLACLHTTWLVSQSALALPLGRCSGSCTGSGRYVGTALASVPKHLLTEEQGPAIALAIVAAIEGWFIWRSSWEEAVEDAMVRNAAN